MDISKTKESACSQVRRPVQTDVHKIGVGDELTGMAMLRASPASHVEFDFAP
jgi:hypothetical protein